MSDGEPPDLLADIARARGQGVPSRPSARHIAREHAQDFREIGRTQGYQAVADIINRHARKPIGARVAEQYVADRLAKEKELADEQARRQERSRPKAAIPVGALDRALGGERREEPAQAQSDAASTPAAKVTGKQSWREEAAATIATKPRNSSK